MRRILPLAFLALLLTPARAQDAVAPGDPRLDVSRIQPEETTFTVTLIQGDVRRDIGTTHSVIAIDEEAGTITAVRTTEMMGQKMADTTRAAWPSLAARAHSSENPQRRLRFTVEDGTLAGDHTPAGAEPEAFELSTEGPVFDSAWIGTLASTLPLAEGYTAVIPAYEYEAGGLTDYTVSVVGQEEIQLADGAKATAWVAEVGREGTPPIRLYLDAGTYKLKQMRMSPQPGIEILITAQTESDGGK